MVNSCSDTFRIPNWLSPATNEGSLPQYGAICLFELAMTIRFYENYYNLSRRNLIICWLTDCKIINIIGSVVFAGFELDEDAGAFG